MAIRALIRKSEDGDFDCKEWHGPDAAKKSIAKAACGFANATGGVIVIGLTARGTGPNMPDLVTAEKPVADREAVKSAVLDIILKEVEPGITGIQVQTVRDVPRSKSGFVLIYVPEMDGPPQRSRQDWRFYVRIASGTVPMEYFQIEDRFGRRPHAQLVLSVTDAGIQGVPMQHGVMHRHIAITLTNVGRGLARFPSFRFLNIPGIQLPMMFDSHQPIWTQHPQVGNWVSFRGGANDVVYPGESLPVVRLHQTGSKHSGSSSWSFPAVEITTEVICDGSTAHRQMSKIDGVK
jgi:hypothetical protein